MKIFAGLISLFALTALVVAAPTMAEAKCKVNQNNQNPGLARLNCLMRVSTEILTRVSKGTSNASQVREDASSIGWALEY